MKRIALVLILAILLPSLLLGWLAIHSIKDQALVLNRQREQIDQAICDTMVHDIHVFMDNVRTYYGQLVGQLERQHGAALPHRFDEAVTAVWAQAAVGAAVDHHQGTVLSIQHRLNEPGRQHFLDNHNAFLTNQRVVEVFHAPQLLSRQITVSAEPVPSPLPENEGTKEEKHKSIQPSTGTSESEGASRHDTAASAHSNAKRRAFSLPSSAPPDMPRQRVEASPHITRGGRFRSARESPSSESYGSFSPPASAPPLASAASAPPQPTATARPSRPSSDALADADHPDLPSAALLEQGSDPVAKLRNVRPIGESQISQSGLDSPSPLSNPDQELSSLNADHVTQSQLTDSEPDGAVARIIDGQLHLLLWQRLPSMPEHTFWVELDLNVIQNDLTLILDRHAPIPASGTAQDTLSSFALLDAMGNVIHQTQAGFTTDWKKPFVATEIGQILPRWEVAAYLLQPESINRSARTARLTLWLITGLLLISVLGGLALIWRSVTHEMRLAAKKTDFVSNVSHELKTPLTSIRLFAEMLEKNEATDLPRTRQYAGVIHKESARLTRIISRLLDFSSLERGQMKFHCEKIELHQIVNDAIAAYRPQATPDTLPIRCVSTGPSELYVNADADALSQVIWNLVSNAEKYAASGGEILVEIHQPEPGKAALSVHDRGQGIARVHERRIFEKFYRIDDSLASGTDGSGIGLALCRQIAEHHDGTLTFQRRRGGGSTFTLNLPLA